MDAGATLRPAYLPNSRWTLLWSVLLTLSGLGATIVGSAYLQGNGDIFDKAPQALGWIVSGVLALLAGHYLVRGPARYAKWILALVLLSRVAWMFLSEHGWDYPPGGGFVELLAFIHALRLSAMDARIEPAPVAAQQA